MFRVMSGCKERLFEERTFNTNEEAREYAFSIKAITPLVMMFKDDSVKAICWWFENQYNGKYW